MGKKGKAKKTKQKKSTQQNKPRKDHTQEVKKTTSQRGMILTIIGLLIGIPGLIAIVNPWISVYPGEILNPYNPFETPFIIKNEGILPIKDIEYQLTIKEAIFNLGTIKGPLSLIRPSNKIPNLPSHKTTAIFLNAVGIYPPAKFKSAMMSIDLSYKSFLLPHIFHNSYTFKTEIKKDETYTMFENYHDSN